MKKTVNELARLSNFNQAPYLGHRLNKEVFAVGNDLEESLDSLDKISNSLEAYRKSYGPKNSLMFNDAQTSRASQVFKPSPLRISETPFNDSCLLKEGPDSTDTGKTDMVRALFQQAPLSEALPALRTPTTGRDRPRRTRTKVVLPITVTGNILRATADSGSEENIIALEVLETHGFWFDQSSQHHKEFQMGNGKIVSAIGRTSLDCRFTNDSALKFACIFYVFERLITPLIMGMDFLQETETLTKNRHRLESRETFEKRFVQVCSLNNPKRRLSCFADGERVLANADTGSEVDLISLAYASKGGFPVESIEEDFESTVQFADGSCSTLSGKIILQVKFGKSNHPHSNVVFHVLEGLTCDLLLGEDLLDEIDAFQSYQEEFLREEGSPAFEVNTIVWFNTIERMFSNIGHRKKRNRSLDSAQIGHSKETLKSCM